MPGTGRSILLNLWAVLTLLFHQMLQFQHFTVISSLKGTHFLATKERLNHSSLVLAIPNFRIRVKVNAKTFALESSVLNISRYQAGRKLQKAFYLHTGIDHRWPNMPEEHLKMKYLPVLHWEFLKLAALCTSSFEDWFLIKSVSN